MSYFSLTHAKRYQVIHSYLLTTIDILLQYRRTIKGIQHIYELKFLRWPNGQYLQVVPKKMTLAEKDAINKKNPQFYSTQLKIQAILPTHELVSLTNFYNDTAKNEVFLLVP